MQFKKISKPVPRLVVSHTGVYATCPGERNICGKHIRGIASRGGIIGIGYFKKAEFGLKGKSLVHNGRGVWVLPVDEIIHKP